MSRLQKIESNRLPVNDFVSTHEREAFSLELQALEANPDLSMLLQRAVYPHLLSLYRRFDLERGESASLFQALLPSRDLLLFGFFQKLLAYGALPQQQEQLIQFLQFALRVDKPDVLGVFMTNVFDVYYPSPSGWLTASLENVGLLTEMLQSDQFKEVASDFKVPRDFQNTLHKMCLLFPPEEIKADTVERLYDFFAGPFIDFGNTVSVNMDFPWHKEAGLYLDCFFCWLRYLERSEPNADEAYYAQDFGSIIRTIPREVWYGKEF